MPAFSYGICKVHDRQVQGVSYSLQTACTHKEISTASEKRLYQKLNRLDLLRNLIVVSAYC